MRNIARLFVAFTDKINVYRRIASTTKQRSVTSTVYLVLPSFKITEEKSFPNAKIQYKTLLQLAFHHGAERCALIVKSMNIFLPIFRSATCSDSKSCLGNIQTCEDFISFWKKLE